MCVKRSVTVPFTQQERERPKKTSSSCLLRLLPGVKLKSFNAFGSGSVRMTLLSPHLSWLSACFAESMQS